MKLSTWIEKNGGRILVARRLKVTPQCLHYWLEGKSTPRPSVMFRIVHLSRGRVSLDDILNETARKKVLS